jgi:hypothetical protein
MRTTANFVDINFTVLSGIVKYYNYAKILIPNPKKPEMGKEPSKRRI